MLLEKAFSCVWREKSLTFIAGGCLYVVLCRGQQPPLKHKLAAEDRRTCKGQPSPENPRKMGSWMMLLSSWINRRRLTPSPSGVVAMCVEDQCWLKLFWLSFLFSYRPGYCNRWTYPSTQGSLRQKTLRMCSYVCYTRDWPQRWQITALHTVLSSSPGLLRHVSWYLLSVARKQDEKQPFKTLFGSLPAFFLYNNWRDE